MNFAVCQTTTHSKVDAAHGKGSPSQFDWRPLVFAVCHTRGTRQTTNFAVCPPFDTRQTRIHGPKSLSAHWTADRFHGPSFAVCPRARHTAKPHLCRVPQARHTAKGILCRVLLYGTRQSKIFFILLFPNSFMWYRGCIWDLILKICAFLGKFAIFWAFISLIVFSCDNSNLICKYLKYWNTVK